MKILYNWGVRLMRKWGHIHTQKTTDDQVILGENQEGQKWKAVP
jgi:hypothetical protein